MNTLYYGDNLEILKNSIKDETIDLIYLDPPFQSGKDYNIIFKPEKAGVKGATSQIKTFEDTWNWGHEANNEYMGLLTGTITTYPPPQKLIDLMKAMRTYLGECPMMAYLCMMAPRLLELKRVLKSTGSIYLHCDPTASHYLKLLMDAIFNTNSSSKSGCFRNEIVWCYTAPTNTRDNFPKKHDVIFRYSKSDNWIFNYEEISIPYSDETVARTNRGSGNQGLYGDNDPEIKHANRLKPKGKIPEDWWVIPRLQGNSLEKLGYPTQKPEALLERIIKASSNKNNTILDPFCGCGTAVAVAERLERKWIGIDVSYLSIDVIIKRFEKNNIQKGKDFKISGVPKDVYSACQLAEKEPFQFEVWAVSQLNATPTVKSGDKGVDGVINFIDHTRADKLNKGIISVKGGKTINPAMVRELIGTVQSHNAAFGILITTEKPTKGMIEVAASEGNYNYSYMEGVTQSVIPKIQLIAVEDLFCDPIRVKLPPNVLEPYKKPEIKKNSVTQWEIEM